MHAACQPGAALCARAKPCDPCGLSSRRCQAMTRETTDAPQLIGKARSPLPHEDPAWWAACAGFGAVT